MGTRLAFLSTALWLSLTLPIRAASIYDDPSIVLYFSFDEGQGNVVADRSGHNNEGRIEKAEWVEGRFGKALRFNGADTYVEVLHNATLDLEVLTLAAWVYKEEMLLQNLGESIISKKQSGAYCLEIHGWENATPNRLDTEMRISGTYHRIADDEEFPLNEWVHCAATYDGEWVRLHKNGKLVKEERWPGSVDFNGANLYVGAESDGGIPDDDHGRFSGVIDEVVVANRPFSEEEIQALMEPTTAVEPIGKIAVLWGALKRQ
ncbi:MAG: hypothetical protein KatS3mg115_0963 [Candidatus Poribacteria bacterium]|nr:MAG: hypothetical protein KatS3mg115_0963 [Candidatus Poribacteria bacterium]